MSAANPKSSSAMDAIIRSDHVAGAGYLPLTLAYGRCQTGSEGVYFTRFIGLPARRSWPRCSVLRRHAAVSVLWTFHSDHSQVTRKTKKKVDILYSTI